MTTETTQLIKLVVDACGTNEATKASLKNLLTRIYLNGKNDGMEVAREIFMSKESINVGDEDHNNEVSIENADKVVHEDLPF